MANAKTFDAMILSTPAMAAGHEMAAGSYVLQLKGNIAIFTNIATGKSFSTDVKVEGANQKFDWTAIESQAKDGAREITSIELGGSNTKIELGE
jgi:hypothetical protein